MARPERINLRAFQQELSERLKHKTAAQVGNMRLALECADANWLVRLSDTGEVLPLPPQVVPVPLTRPWFLGIANVRGALYGVVDFASFVSGRAAKRGSGPAGIGGSGQPVTSGARLVLLGSRFTDIRAGLLVEKVLGLRNLADFEAMSVPGPDTRAVEDAADVAAESANAPQGVDAQPSWSARSWTDGSGTRWRELDLVALTTDPEFIQVGA